MALPLQITKNLKLLMVVAMAITPKKLKEMYTFYRSNAVNSYKWIDGNTVLVQIIAKWFYFRN